MTTKEKVDLLNQQNGYANDKMDSIVQFFNNSHVVAFDVDQTLVMWDETPYEPGPGKLKFIMPGNNKTVYLKPHEKHLFTLKTYKPRGFQVIVWSAAGSAWVQEVIKVLGIEKNVDIGMSKLSLYYDDLPADQILGQHLYFHDNIDTEKWMPIIGYENKYEVSNFGRVRSKNQFGQYNIKEIYTTDGGYPIVQLNYKTKNKTILVHRLVAQAFIDNPENKKVVNHIDGNRKNNNAYNLEWVTVKENNQRKTKNPKFNYHSGERNSSAKLTQQKVIEIYEKALKRNKTFTEIGKEYNVSDTTVSYILKKKTWKSVTDGYDKEKLK